MKTFYKTVYNRDHVFIIGNGFDLDLGRQTKFSDFYNSSFYPKDNESSFNRYIKDREHTDNWFDLEQIMQDYSTLKSKNSVGKLEEDKLFFELITQRLKQFINNSTIPKWELTRMPSGKLIPNVISFLLFEEIFCCAKYSVYSFNYTDLSFLINKIVECKLSRALQDFSIEDLKQRFNMACEYVHGTAFNASNLILGGGRVQVNNGYEFIRKDMQLRHSSLVSQLNNARKVVIYGHSLSRPDYFYFEKFLNDILESKSKCRELHIITKNTVSISLIKKNLEQINPQYSNIWTKSNIFFQTSEDLLSEIKTNMLNGLRIIRGIAEPYRLTKDY